MLNKQYKEMMKFLFGLLICILLTNDSKSQVSFFQNDQSNSLNCDNCYIKQQLNNEQTAKNTAILHSLITISSLCVVSFIIFFYFFVKNKKKLNVILKQKETIEQQQIELNNTIKKLSKREAELNVLNKEKDRFFSLIAHELRNPLSSIVMASDILSYQTEIIDNERIKLCTDSINKASHRSIKLIENLALWAKNQDGSLKQIPEVLDLTSIIKDNIELLRQFAENKRIEVLLDIDVEAGLAYADRNMVDTVVRNLTTNSLKFTNPQGKITIMLRKSGKKYIEITVSDNGKGVNQYDLKKIFNSKETISNIGTCNEKGTGLGLVLCKEFVEKNGGKIWAESQEGKGSTFHFTLPSISA